MVMEGDSDSDSDAPEEFTSRQGLEKEEEIREIIRENKARLVFPEADEVADGDKCMPKKNKRKSGSRGVEPVIVKDLPGPQCAQNSMEFLKKRKMAVPRSASSLRNPKQAFRYLAKSGMLGNS